MRKITLILVSICLLLSGCQLNSNSSIDAKENSAVALNAKTYDEVIASLPSEEKSAIVELNDQIAVFLTTEGTYDYEGGQAALHANVYFLLDGTVVSAGELESTGTAYPLAHNGSGFYVRSGHAMQHYIVDAEVGTLTCDLAIEERFNTEGGATYLRSINGEEEVISEEEYLSIYEESYDDDETIYFN